MNALHPATYMNTAMVRRAGVTPISTVEQGAEAILNLAMGSDGARHSGCYLMACARHGQLRRHMTPKHAAGSGRSACP